MSESLREDDLAYFKTAMDGLAKAQSILAFVQQVLVEKYALNIGDNIELDGRIIRTGGVDSLPDEVKECLIPNQGN